MIWNPFSRRPARAVTYTPTARTTVHPPEPPPAVLPVTKIALDGPMSTEEMARLIREMPSVVLPEGPVQINPALPVEAQIILRIMGEDLAAADELIKGMRPVDRSVLSFYADEIYNRVNKVNQDEGRF